MAVSVSPDVIVYVCTNCIPQGGRLPRQWLQGGARVRVHEIPCSGKMDGQYLFHALEGGARGICVVACPKGECHLAQGNYRALCPTCLSKSAKVLPSSARRFNSGAGAHRLPCCFSKSWMRW